ncbi:MAG: hypothetical protein ACJ74D_08835 [Gaiellaceae bacterium]|jgi:hypothetical protein
MEAVSARLRRVVSGPSARDKIVEPSGIELQQIERCLASAAEKERRA